MKIFNGTWTIDISESLVWDDKLAKHVPDEIGEEVITLRNEDGMQDYEVLYGDRPKIRMGYTAEIDGTEWVPYAVREIISTSGDVEAELNEFKVRVKASDGHRARRFELGKAYGLVRIISVDDRTHYRVTRDPMSEKAQHMMLRRMADDGKSYRAVVLDVDGIIHRIRKFVRID